MKKRVNGLGLKTLGRSDLTVGTDPEFELVGPSGCVVNANRIHTEGAGPYAEIGVDGAGNQIEFRPHHSPLPIKVLSTFKSLLKRFSTEHSRHSLSWRGDRYPIGGHIHIGNQQLHLATRYDVAQQHALCGVLDDFVYEKVRCLNGTARGAYDGRGKLRTQDWGVEYRACPAAVFASKELARVTLRLVKGIVSTFLSKKHFSYEYPPQLADYKKVGQMSAKSCQLFFAEIERLLSVRASDECDMLAAWHINRPRLARRPRAVAAEPVAQTLVRDRVVSLRLGDEWADEMRQYLTAWTRGLHPNRPVTLTLFGLAAHRGAVVANLELEGYTTIEHSAARNDIDSIYIGLPYEIRNMSINSVHADEILFNLKRALRAKLRAVEPSMTVVEALGQDAPSSLPNCWSNASPVGDNMGISSSASSDPERTP